MKIVISSGHGKHVSGAVGIINEVTEARKVVSRVAEYTRESGAEAVEFHEDDAKSQGDNLINIIAFHNKQTRDYDVSVHFNAHSQTNEPRGVEVLHVSAGTLAAKVSKSIADASGLKNRGAKCRTNLAFLNKTNTPAILIEVCFVDSTADVKLYQGNFEAICQAISEAIVGKQSTVTPGTPSSGTPIMGNSVISAEAMAEFLSSKNNAPKISCTGLELARLFIDEGWDENVRGDIAFCQSIHETGWFKFGGDVLPEQNNFCGLGATNATLKGKGAWFDTPRMGVRAQVQHLKAYASKEPLAHATIDPRFHLVTRGVAPNWEDLNGRWAVPGTTYAQQILKVYDDLCTFASEQPAHWADEHYEYLTLIGMKINEKRFSDKLTRGEAFALLAEYDKSRIEESSKKTSQKARLWPRPITLHGTEEGEDIASKNLATELAKTVAAKSAAPKKGAAKKKKTK